MASISTSGNLSQQVEADIKAFLSARRSKPFFGENNLQMDLAIYLENTRRYGSLALEYYVPVGSLQPHYPWLASDRIYVDIVVEKDGQYVPVELKYKTKTISSNTFTCFGKQVKGIPLTNQLAYNDNLYRCWKDVRRLELIKRAFAGNVAGGIFVLVANDEVYWKGPSSENASYAQFSMEEGKMVNHQLLQWNVKVPSGFPNFHIDGTYTCHWQKTGIAIPGFRFCMLEV